MFHPFIKVVKKTYIALVMLSNVHYIPAQIPETTPLPGGNQVECSSGLTIKNFSSHNNTWKVVVSGMDIEGNVVKEKIKYKAIGHDPNKILTWKLFSGVGSEDYWDLKPLNSTTWNSTGEAYIPYEKHPANNSDFGEANGIVKLTSGSLSVLSTDPIPNPGKAIKVYFRKDDPNYFDKNVPNWFYYWSQSAEAKSLLTTEGIKMFKMTGDIPMLNADPTQVTFSLGYLNTGTWKWNPNGGVKVTYGNTEAGENWYPRVAQFGIVPNSNNSCNGFRKVMLGYGEINFNINIGESCGYRVETQDYGNIDSDIGHHSPGTTVQFIGIYGFTSILKHEVGHFKVREKFWKDTGYDSDLDCDHDLFPDAWEMSPQGVDFGFIAGNMEEYNGNYNSKNITTAGPSAYYQEVFCRLLETVSKNEELKDLDWSYDPDPNSLFQGKNW